MQVTASMSAKEGTPVTADNNKSMDADSSRDDSNSRDAFNRKDPMQQKQNYIPTAEKQSHKCKSV